MGIEEGDRLGFAVGSIDGAADGLVELGGKLGLLVGGENVGLIDGLEDGASLKLTDDDGFWLGMFDVSFREGCTLGLGDGAWMLVETVLLYGKTLVGDELGFITGSLNNLNEGDAEGPFEGDLKGDNDGLSLDSAVTLRQDERFSWPRKDESR